MQNFRTLGLRIKKSATFSFYLTNTGKLFGVVVSQLAPYSNLRIAEALAGLHVLSSNLCQWLVATTLYFVLKFPFHAGMHFIALAYICQ